MKCFVDTSGFVALYRRNDDNHEEAKAIWHSLRKHDVILYTTRDCIAETIILVRRREGYKQALLCGNDLWESPVLEILRANLREDRLAWELFKKFSDKELSFVDCLSFAMMKELRISQAFTFDRDFEEAGFKPVRP